MKTGSPEDHLSSAEFSGSPEPNPETAPFEGVEPEDTSPEPGQERLPVEIARSAVEAAYPEIVQPINTETPPTLEERQTKWLERYHAYRKELDKTIGAAAKELDGHNKKYAISDAPGANIGRLLDVPPIARLFSR